MNEANIAFVMNSMPIKLLSPNQLSVKKTVCVKMKTYEMTFYFSIHSFIAPSFSFNF